METHGPFGVDERRHAPKLRHRVGAQAAARQRALLRGVAPVVLAVAMASCGSDRRVPDTEPSTAKAPIAALETEFIAVDGAPWGVAVDDGVVWVTDTSRGTVLRVDAAIGEVVAELATGASDPRNAGVAVLDGQVWIANLGGTVDVLDAATGKPIVRVETGDGEPAAVSISEWWVWVPTHGPGGGLVRLDRARPDTGAQTVALPESGFAVATDENVVWVAGLEGRVFAVDADTAAVVRTVEVGDAPRGVAVADGDVWVSLRDARAVVRLDAATGKEVARIATEGQPWPIAAGGGYVWVATLEGRLLRIDPARNDITAEAEVAPQPRGVAVGADAVWVASQTGGLARVSPS